MKHYPTCALCSMERKISEPKCDIYQLYFDHSTEKHLHSTDSIYDTATYTEKHKACQGQKLHFSLSVLSADTCRKLQFGINSRIQMTEKNTVVMVYAQVDISRLLDRETCISAWCTLPIDWQRDSILIFFFLNFFTDIYDESQNNCKAV